MSGHKNEPMADHQPHASHLRFLVKADRMIDGKARLWV